MSSPAWPHPISALELSHPGRDLPAAFVGQALEHRRGAGAVIGVAVLPDLQLGLDALEGTPDLQQEMIKAVGQHHEYLDGSGYPHGLQGNEIPDLVRMLTICDVFGALIERRSYKPPISGEDAYQILLDMGPKLDKDLRREFRFAQKFNQAA